MELKKSIIIPLFVIVAFATVFVSCKDEDTIRDRAVEQRENLTEESYKFEKTLVLRDSSNSYFAEVKFSSNDKDILDNWINASPAIKVTKIQDDQSLSGLSSMDFLLTGDTIKKKSDFKTKILNTNTPSGYTLQVYLANKSINSTSGSAGVSPSSFLPLQKAISESFSTYTWENGVAKGVTTTIASGHQATFHYYGKWGNFWGLGYKDRGYRTLGAPGGITSYTFISVPNYTEYVGVKTEAYTTYTVASGSSINFTF